MNDRSRREFLTDVGRGIMVAGVGAALASDLGVAPAWAGEETGSLTFGKLEPLAARMQQTPLEKLLPALVKELHGGTSLDTLVAAGALANARTFGGQDYTGFHALMALAPAHHMAREMPAGKAALPVLKVLYRNTHRIHQVGGRAHEVLHPVEPAALPSGKPAAELLRKATRGADFKRAEKIFAAAAAEGTPEEAFHDLQLAVRDDADVHRVVLAWRAWALLDLTGEQNAHTLLRQSVRYCADQEQERIARGRPEPAIRRVLPKLLDQYRLVGRELGGRRLEESDIDRLARVIYAEEPARAAEAAAGALADGAAPDDVAEALALAANMLVLHDPGRRRAEGDGKPKGSVHGSSVGVHASDAANAWWHIARVSPPRDTAASLVAGAYHTAGRSGDLNSRAYPLPEHLEAVKSTDTAALLSEANEAIRAKDQTRVCAVVHRYGELGGAPRPMFDLMLRYGTSEDGALHAEKYYRTTSEEFARARPGFRWRHLIGLARVTASEYGNPAPGYDEACRLLKVT